MTAPTAKLQDTSTLIQDGSAAGFEWTEGEVAYRPDPKQSTKVSLGKAPHVKVTDVSKFEAYFPGVILQALDGTSILVACQAVTRRMLKAVRAGGPKPTWEAMQLAVLNALRGIKNRGGVVLKIQAFGKTFSSQEEYIAFGTELLTAKGLDAETISEILMGAVETAKANADAE